MRISRFIDTILLLTLVGLLINQAGTSGTILPGSPPDHLSQPSLARADFPYTHTYYLPFIAKHYPLVQPFGLESHSNFTNTTISQRTQDLNVGWTRMGMRVSWRNLQPVQGGSIDWNQLSTFEAELNQLKSASITPVVVIYDSPDWAVIPRTDGQLTSCAAIASDKFDDFANFLAQLVARYGNSQYGLLDWEIGNEVDVDPDLVAIDSGYGCWGDISDPYYGGRHYGQMLKVVTPVLRAQSPGVRIWLGGLLLDRPNSPGDYGYPERFLEGVLIAGGAPYFDVLPYHWYPSYFHYEPCNGCSPLKIDFDLNKGGNWDAWGGGSKGKAEFLKSVLVKYGVTKPLSLNETALGCEVRYFSGCEQPPADEFLQSQADYVAKSALRAISAGASTFSWFTLVDEWRFTGLLDSARQPKPVYYAYQTLIDQYHQGIFKGAVSYGAGIEGYAIQRDQEIVHVVWTVGGDVRTIYIPQGKLLAIYSRDGASIGVPDPNNGLHAINLDFSPTYIHLAP